MADFNHIVRQKYTVKGGYYLLQIILLNELRYVGPAIDGKIDSLIFFENKFPILIETLVRKNEIDISFEREKEGDICNVTLKGLIPENTIEHRQQVEAWWKEQFGFIARDRNGEWRLFAEIGNSAVFKKMEEKQRIGSTDYISFEIEWTCDHLPYYLTAEIDYVIANANYTMFNLVYSAIVSQLINQIIRVDIKNNDSFTGGNSITIKTYRNSNVFPIVFPITFGSEIVNETTKEFFINGGATKTIETIIETSLLTPGFYETSINGNWEGAETLTFKFKIQ